MQFKINQRIDLARENRPMRYMPPLECGNHQAHEWVVEVTERGERVDLTGYSVTVYVTPAGRTAQDAVTASVRMQGSATGNRARCLFQQAAYATEGEAVCVMRIAQAGGQLVALAAMCVTFRRYTSDALIDPGKLIPSLDELLAQIETIEAATAAANKAASTAATAAGNANAKASLANTAASNANSKASAAQTAADKANAAAQNWESSTAANSNKLGGIAAASYLQKHSLRTMSINIATSAWTGSGPYTATITRSDVTTKTWVDVSLTTASLANYAASIDWSTETAGKIVLTTAVKPTGTIAGTLVLMEVA